MRRASLIGSANPKGSCTWFLASEKNCYSIRKWRDALVNRWSNDNTPEWMMNRYIFPWNYFSIDYEWYKLVKNDELVMRQWKDVPYIPADEETLLFFKVTGYSYEIENKLMNDPPPILKLDWRQWTNDPDTNLHVALRSSFANVNKFDRINQ